MDVVFFVMSTLADHLPWRSCSQFEIIVVAIGYGI